MSYSPYLPIFHFTRGEVIESIHYGAVSVADASGRLVAWYGDPDVVTFLRSSSKPFQALPFIENGGQEAFGLTQKEVALICASHSGTPEHVAVVESIQAKTGVSESDLLCGTHSPYHKATADAMREHGEKPHTNHHNCSGKHTGMLALARMLGFPPEPDSLPYTDPGHPVQQMILESFADLCDLAPEDVALGVDGCSAPNFAVPLQNAARAFARLCDPGRLPAKRAASLRTICAAMVAYPDMVGGPDSFDTHLMQAAEGKVVCKGGAEGYQAFGIMPGAIQAGSPGLGVAFKISDGDLKGHNRPVGDPLGHVRPPVALEILRQLGVLSTAEMEKLADYGPRFKVENWRKLCVGSAYPCFSLNMAE